MDEIIDDLHEISLKIKMKKEMNNTKNDWAIDNYIYRQYSDVMGIGTVKPT
jgi:hypothetical protein